ncbi:hypothetical protein CKM354_000484200 [Cercospora kikuchii]|uniref:Uncharacterized protein n=1 Tax=Cercospora kikuchii TaxID=84275 RepID=A0A9P3CGK2_9PEZI|nr:uncharacterized protein CKM354_000484200 [Cercospora kikuchii]GIZ41541.1 hypothetical protein CKM354_000484200 [Cercospora kikuchii]
MQAQSIRFSQAEPLPNNQAFAWAPGGGYPNLAYAQRLPETQAYTANYCQQFRELPNQADQSWAHLGYFTIPDQPTPLTLNTTTRRPTRTSSSIKYTQASPLAQASTPTKVVKRRTNEDRVTRKPVPPRKNKIVKDVKSVVSFMVDNEALALIQGSAGTGDPNAPQYLNHFNSKQDALDHLPASTPLRLHSFYQRLFSLHPDSSAPVTSSLCGNWSWTQWLLPLAMTPCQPICQSM